MSKRVFSSLRTLTPSVEVYSIDEAFLHLENHDESLLYERAADLRKKVLQWTGIPISIGIAPTKTLAKAANHMAKRHRKSNVCALIENSDVETALRQIPVGDIWGIGRQLNKKCLSLGINNAYQLKIFSKKLLRSYFGVVIERLVMELEGTACVEFALHEQKQSIRCSRTFAKPLSDFQSLSEAVAHHTSRACFKLRQQNSRAKYVSIFIKEHPHTLNRYHSEGMALPDATFDTSVVMKTTLKLLKSVYTPTARFRSAGVTLHDIIDKDAYQKDFFKSDTSHKRTQFLSVFDELNKKYGSQAIYLAAEGTRSAGAPKSVHRTNRYTTHWPELMRALAN